MKSLPWFRAYTEMIDDEKLGLLAFEDRWHFVALLCLKGKGVLDSEPDAEMLQRKVALKMGLAVAELEKVARRLARMGLVDKDTFQPMAWDERQQQSDQDLTNAQRQQRYRERHKKVVTVDNALRNAPVTGIEEEEDIDIDIEEDKKEDTPRKRSATFAIPDWINASHWSTWHSSPKRKKATTEQKQLAVNKLDAWRKDGRDYAGALENAAMGGYQGLFLPDQKSGAQPAKPAKTFAERDREAGWARWEEQTGRVHPDRAKADSGQVIDITPRTLEITQ